MSIQVQLMSDGMTPPILLPVRRVPRTPNLLRLRLVQAAVRIARPLTLLPAALALALARLRRTKPLLGNLRTRPERLAARCAPAAPHGWLPIKEPAIACRTTLADTAAAFYTTALPPSADVKGGSNPMSSEWVNFGER